MGLLDLPPELLLDIFSLLNLTEMIPVARTHPYMRIIIDNYLIKELIFNSTLEMIGKNEMMVGECSFRNVGFETILNVLKYFGQHITKLKIHFSRFTTQDQHKSLSEHISKYCAASLKEIYFHLCYTPYYILEGLEGPFPNVESVLFDDATFRIRTNFSAIFPAIRSLDVGSVTLPAEDLQEHFPNLKQLKIPKYNLNHASQYDSLERTLRLNPQLKHLSIVDCQYNILRMVNDIRPDLESLDIGVLYLSENDNMTIPLRFSNMKKLNIFFLKGLPDEDIQRIPLEFGNLAEIEILHNADYWINVLMNNTNLKKMITKAPLNEEHLDRIADGLTKLEEFSMNCYQDNEAHGRAVQFMRKAKQLKKISLIHLDDDVCQEITENLYCEWKRTEITQNACSFARIQLK